MTEQQEQNHNMTPDAASDVHRITLDERQIILIGTAHVSRASVDLVRRVLDTEKPDCICVELDEKRYDSLSRRKRWETQNLKEIIYKKQLSTLLANLILAAYQKKLGAQLGVVPGAELLEACTVAKENNTPLALCDRDARVTMRRAWHATSFFKKSYLLASLLTSLFDRTEITEEKLSELKETDALSELMLELGEALPELKRVLIDERDTFLAEKIKAASGKHIVAVVGAGHVAGIKKALYEDRSDELARIDTIPPVSPIWQILAWVIPLLILTSIALIGWQKGGAVAGDNIIFWCLATGVLSAIGGALALAHPLTILSAFLAAPFTALTPIVGAGHITAFVQVMRQPPLVMEFESALTDMATVTGWWRNRLLRVFLTFVLTSLGAAIGAWVGGYEIFSNLVS